MGIKEDINDLTTNVLVDWREPSTRFDYRSVLIPVKDHKMLEVYVPDIACKSHIDEAIAVLKGIRENLPEKPKREYKGRVKKEASNES